MSFLIGKLTRGELYQVLGHLLVKVGEMDDAGDFADGVQMSEIFDLSQGLISELLKEYSDDDVPQE